MYETFNDYNRFTHIPNFSMNIINYLIKNNETIWKLLKYNTSDALSKSNLIMDEKTDLIYSGMSIVDDPEDYKDAEKGYRVFTKGMSTDAITEACSQLHIYIGDVRPRDHIVSNVDMYIQIISHNGILILDDYRNRNEVMLQQILTTLNGADIEGITNLSFDKGNNVRWFKFSEKWYEGYQLVMSCKTTYSSSQAGE